ncbi:MAG: Na+/H+ antiporter subunit E [Methanobacteriaceae archaeon]|nr:Na+/H+ antiporter subunit E [Methanobacteriaceae archaeon]
MFLTRIYYAIAYFFVLIWEIIKAVVDVTIRSLKGGEYNPILVDIDTVLKRPVAQTILANSITLTPGTLTVDLDSEAQKLKVAIIAPREKEEIIPFEKYIKGMLE